MSEPSAAMVRLVWQRALDRCEYCRMHQSLQVATFHMEHIVPSSAGGPSSPENLALACPACNLHKSNRLMVSDPDSQLVVPLFHPRLHVWSDHLTWSGYEVVGLTPIGRAAIAALDLNHSRRLKVRMAEETFRLFPPQ
jgi:hypothetical protein